MDHYIFLLLLCLVFSAFTVSALDDRSEKGILLRTNNELANNKNEIVSQEIVSITSKNQRELQLNCVKDETQLKAALDAVPLGLTTPTVITLCTSPIKLTKANILSSTYFARIGQKNIEIRCASSSKRCVVNGLKKGFGFITTFGSIISIIGVNFIKFSEFPVIKSNFLSEVTIENCNFKDNVGLAIDMQSSPLTLKGNCTFENNKGGGFYGGAIYLFWSILEASGNIVFSGNEGDYGGAIASVFSTSEDQLNMNGLTFTKNKAKNRVCVHNFFLFATLFLSNLY